MGKMKYGIDLGTTNSSICRTEHGVPEILKVEVTDETMPSCVSFNKKQNIIVGHAAYRNMKSERKRATHTWSQATTNSFVEFKRTMGTDTTYHSSNMDKDYYSEELSAEVLKALKTYVTDDVVKEAVITVPAKFTVNQKTATMKAATLAGIEHCELIQEPVAASIAYGLDSNNKDGYWMVFDFGGGTFDAALIRIENGIIQVFDTEGDNYLGGKNIDYAITDQLLIPYLKENYNIEGILTDNLRKEMLREAMKAYAEEIKNMSSFHTNIDFMSNIGELGEDEDGEEMELDLSLSQQQVFDVMRPVFQRAVDISLTLLNRNNLNGDKLDRIVLVGGPTFSPLIRGMLTEQIGCHVDTNINPMTAVSVGASIYASTLESQIQTSGNDSSKVKLQVSYEATTVEPTEWVAMKLSEGDTHCKVLVQLKSEDGSWVSERVEVDSVGNVIEVALKKGMNAFYAETFDEHGTFLPCDATVSIMSGTKFGSAPLPYNIGISTWDKRFSKAVFLPIFGLEKNQILPASGTVTTEKTMTDLRPGIQDDKLYIPIYQADDYKEGTSSALYEYVADIVVTGEDVDSYISKGSDTEVMIRVDSSEMMEVEIYFPLQDITVIKKLDTSKHQSMAEAGERIKADLQSAETLVRLLKQKKRNVNIQSIERTLKTIRLENENDTEKKMVLEHLKEVYRRIEEQFMLAERAELEKDTEEWLQQVKRHQRSFGNEDTAKEIEQLEHDMKAAIYHNDKEELQRVRQSIINLDYTLGRRDILEATYYKFRKEFNTANWVDEEQAREHLDKMRQLIIKKAPTEDLEEESNFLWMLYQSEEKEVPQGPTSDSENGSLLYH